VLFDHDSSAAPHQTASPVCGTKNFVSVRLYSAPHCIGQLSPFSEYAPSASRFKLRGSGRVPLAAHLAITNEKFQMVLRRRHVVSTKFSRSLHRCCSCEHAGATVIRRDIWQDKQ